MFLKGEHWFTDKYEKLEVNVSGKLVGDYSRPMTPPDPMTVVSSNNVNNKKNNFNSDAKSYICVSQQSRIDPQKLIRKLTELGVTGAYLADLNIARQIYRQFAVLDEHFDANAINDVILFVSYYFYIAC